MRIRGIVDLKRRDLHPSLRCAFTQFSQREPSSPGNTQRPKAGPHLHEAACHMPRRSVLLVRQNSSASDENTSWSSPLWHSACRCAPTVSPAKTGEQKTPKMRGTPPKLRGTPRVNIHTHVYVFSYFLISCPWLARGRTPPPRIRAPMRKGGPLPGQ